MTFCNNETCLTKEYCSVHVSKAVEVGLLKHLLSQQDFNGDEFMCPVATAKVKAKEQKRWKKEKHL